MRLKDILCLLGNRKEFRNLVETSAEDARQMLGGAFIPSGVHAINGVGLSFILKYELTKQQVQHTFQTEISP
jgi:hypothetical protein